MKDFIIHNWDSILVVLAIIAAIVFFAVRGKKQIVYKILYGLVTEAERIYGSGTGSVKKAYVVQKVYSYLPAILKFFITYSALEDMIERALKEAKAKWAEEAGVTEYINSPNTTSVILNEIAISDDTDDDCNAPEDKK